MVSRTLPALRLQASRAACKPRDVRFVPLERWRPAAACLFALYTHVAWGKVLVARQDGKSIPPDWGVDKDGKPATDPNAVVGLAPTGGHKGYALAAMVEILCAHLAGVPFGLHVTKMYGELDKPRNLGHFMLALDVARFTDPALFRSQIDLLLKEIRSEEPADPSRPPLAPGDPERLSAARRVTDGIPLPDTLIAELNALGASLGCLALNVGLLRYL